MGSPARSFSACSEGRTSLTTNLTVVGLYVIAVAQDCGPFGLIARVVQDFFDSRSLLAFFFPLPSRAPHRLLVSDFRGPSPSESLSTRLTVGVFLPMTESRLLGLFHWTPSPLVLHRLLRNCLLTRFSVHFASFHCYRYCRCWARCSVHTHRGCTMYIAHEWGHFPPSPIARRVSAHAV